MGKQYPSLSLLRSDQWQEEYHPFVPKIFIPGFIRGMTFANKNEVIVGSSLDRNEDCFQNLPLGENLKSKSVEQKCGFYVIDITSMDIIHHFIFHR